MYTAMENSHMDRMFVININSKVLTNLCVGTLTLKYIILYARDDVVVATVVAPPLPTFSTV